jgi:hypothetical protein
MQRRVILLAALAAAHARVAAAQVADAPANAGSGGGSGSGSGSATSAAPDGGGDPDAPGMEADAPPGKSFHGPFQSSHLFSMPVADTVGAYMITISGDGSLLQQPGFLTAEGVIAAGFGDIAQLEYRHSEAISVTGVNAPVPGVGVQLKLPLPQGDGIPAFAIAYRRGVPRDEDMGATRITETVTDFYVVGRLRIPHATWLTLHGGLRYSSAELALSGTSTASETKQLWLPAGGYEVQMNADARIIGEIQLAPQFSLPMTATPQIGYAVIGRFGLRWALVPELTLDASLGYQVDSYDMQPGGGIRDVVQQWDIRLGAEVFVPWGALACRAVGAFCEERRKHKETSP